MEAYRSKNLYKAAFLSLSGIPVELEFEGDVVVFTCPLADALNSLERYNNGAQVSALAFTHEVQRIRSRMLALKRTGGIS